MAGFAEAGEARSRKARICPANVNTQITGHDHLLADYMGPTTRSRQMVGGPERHSGWHRPMLGLLAAPEGRFRLYSRSEIIHKALLRQPRSAGLSDRHACLRRSSPAPLPYAHNLRLPLWLRWGMWNVEGTVSNAASHLRGNPNTLG